MKKVLPKITIFVLLIILLLLVYMLKIVYQEKLYKSLYNDVSNVSDVYGVDRDLLLSIIKAESGFNESALSSKGAVGLMQIMPTTAKFICDEMGVPYYENMLLNGRYNMMLGAFYIKYLEDKFKDSKTMSAAYNAGEGNVAKWLNDKKYSSNGVELTSIPFKETEKYVERVARYYLEFRSSNAK